MGYEIAGLLFEITAASLSSLAAKHSPSPSRQPSMASIRARLQFGVGGRLSW